MVIGNSETCKACQASIVWLTTASGKAMPCDPEIITVVTDHGLTVKGRIPHWATCPSANEFRRKKASAAMDAPEDHG